MKRTNSFFLTLLALMLGITNAHAETVNEKDFTLSWPLGKGTDDVTAAEVKTAGLFSVAEFDYGKMTVSTQRTAGTSQQTLYKPSNHNAGAANDDDVLTFTIKPKKGLTFAPKSFSFESSKWGTGGGKFDVVAIAGGKETVLATAVSPARNNEFSALSYDLSAVTLDESGLVLKVRVYSLASLLGVPSFKGGVTMIISLTPAILAGIAFIRTLDG